MSSSKLFIPQEKDEDPSCHIVGILERKRPETSTEGKPLAMILHGSMGHKDYIFQRQLASLLPIDSIRFDFRGNLESGGKWGLSSLPNEIDDIQCVARYMHKSYGYMIRVVIGHSKGSVTGCKWISSGSEEASQVEAYVNVAGRHRMYKFRYLYNLYDEQIKTQGYGVWKVKVAGKPVDARIYPEDIEAFSNFDTTYVSRDFPPNVDVLTIHGLEDGIVPPYDAVLHAQAFDNRPGGEGRHTLHFIEEADHNFIGHHEEVNATIVEWLERRLAGEVRFTGIWRSRKSKSRL